MSGEPPQSDLPAQLSVADLPAIAGGPPIRSLDRRIVFGAPLLGDEEAAAVAECIRSRWVGMGRRVEEFERQFAAYKGRGYAAAVSSCSAALHLTLLALGIQPGDEVIVPSLTFCSTVHAILHVGAVPVLVDSDPASQNLSPSAVEQAISFRTRAIIVVHLCGRSCDMDAILAIAAQHQLKVVEDCAHAVETTYHGTPAGLLGDAGCFSFYPTKSITTGDGGMVLSRHRELVERVKLLSYNGVASSAWSRFSQSSAGYQVAEAGFKYNMTDLEASLALPQMPHLEARWSQRRQLWQQYDGQLAGLPLTLPALGPAESRHACHLYTVLLRFEHLRASRNQVVAAMEAENIGVGIHYEPVHRQPFFTDRFGDWRARLPHANSIGERTLSLPLSAAMSDEDVSDVCRALRRILQHFAA